MASATGVDPVAAKVDLINAGQSPIIEANIQEIITEAFEANRLRRAVQDSHSAVQTTDVSFVCVGTPSQINGNLDLTYIRRVCQEIGLALKSKGTRHTVVIRSTVLPGTMRGIVIPMLEEQSGKRAGVSTLESATIRNLREALGGNGFQMSRQNHRWRGR